MKPAPELDLYRIRQMPPKRRAAFIASLPQIQVDLLRDEVQDFEKYWARPAQKWPKGRWRTWLILAGRAFGKTRTGSEQTHRWAFRNPGGRIALIARTAADARDTMIEGVSGIMKTGWPSFKPEYLPSNRRIVWPNGAMATVFTAKEPDLLRGPEVGFYWADELASWQYLHATWDNLQMALRGGGKEPPCGVITSTPRPLRLLRQLVEADDCVVTGGSTYENKANLPPSYLQYLLDKYEGSDIGRQELHAMILDEAEGALWNRAIIDGPRVQETPPLDRIVVGVDPAVSTGEGSSETGIIVVGACYYPDRPTHFYVLEDRSGGYKPNQWATQVLTAYAENQADRVIGEVNNGGDMVENTIRTQEPDIPFRAVHASKGKRTRAEPVSALYEQGRVHHVGSFTGLEDQMCTWEPDISRESPDRVDALVWAVTELMTAKDLRLPELTLGQLRQTSQWE